MARKSKKTTPQVVVTDYSRRIAELDGRISQNIVILTDHVGRLRYTDPVSRREDLSFCHRFFAMVQVAKFNPELYERDNGVQIGDFLSKLAKQGEQESSSYTINFKTAGDIRSAPGIAIQDTIQRLRSDLALYIRYNKDQIKLHGRTPQVPPQLPAPIRVALEDASRLRLDISQTHKGNLPVTSIDRIRAGIQELLSRTIEQIGHSSNVDPRLSPNLKGLFTYLSIDMEEMPIEALGLNFQFAKRSFASARETVPDPIAEQIDQILATVNVILNQYDEWRLYLAAEAALSISKSDLTSIIGQSEKLIDFLEENQKVVDPGIIQRFKEILDAYTQGLVNAEAVAVPLVESFSNVFSAICRYLIGHIPDTIANSVAPGSVVLFLGFSMKAVEMFTPTMAAFPPMSYLIDVQKFAQKQFSLLKDSLPIRHL